MKNMHKKKNEVFNHSERSAEEKGKEKKRA